MSKNLLFGGPIPRENPDFCLCVVQEKCLFHQENSQLISDVWKKKNWRENRVVIFLSLAEAPLPDPAPDPTQHPKTDPKRTPNRPETEPNGAWNGAETEPKWTEIKLMSGGTAQGVLSGWRGVGVVRENENHYPCLFKLKMCKSPIWLCFSSRALAKWRLQGHFLERAPSRHRQDFFPGRLYFICFCKVMFRKTIQSTLENIA